MIEYGHAHLSPITEIVVIHYTDHRAWLWRSAPITMPSIAVGTHRLTSPIPKFGRSDAYYIHHAVTIKAPPLAFINHVVHK